jgi:hypothetical protein
VDPADYGTQHIFFDDSAYEGEACQVDVVDAVSGSKLEYKNVIGKYVVKVEPQRAIMEADYFVKLIDAAEQKRSEEIERVEMGGTEEETLLKKAGSGKEWEKLQAASNEEYLMRTVLPVLYQGMKVVDLERPEAPLEYLALYLLKHQDQVKLPQKPQKQQ